MGIDEIKIEPLKPGIIREWSSAIFNFRCHRVRKVTGTDATGAYIYFHAMPEDISGPCVYPDLGVVMWCTGNRYYPKSDKKGQTFYDADGNWHWTGPDTVDISQVIATHPRVEPFQWVPERDDPCAHTLVRDNHWLFRMWNEPVTPEKACEEWHCSTTFYNCAEPRYVNGPPNPLRQLPACPQCKRAEPVIIGEPSDLPLVVHRLN